MDVERLVTKVLYAKNEIQESIIGLPKESSRGELLALKKANDSLAELLATYETGKWKPVPNGNNRTSGEQIEESGG